MRLNKNINWIEYKLKNKLKKNINWIKIKHSQTKL